MSGEAKPSILVVEDENVVAMDLVSSLQKLGYPIAGVAASGEEAIDIAERVRPGLVLMDVNLRGVMDGIQAAQQIQDRFFIPVVYLTAYSDETTLERARVTHPFGYVLKPFEDREIEIAIHIAVFRHRLERALRDSQRRLDAILSSIGEAVVATDTQRCVTFLNRAAESLLGWKSERATGRRLADVLRLLPQPDGTLRLARGNSESCPVELVESPVTDSNAALTGYVTVVRDISERMRAQDAHDRELVERAARAAAEKEHERARLKSEITGALSDITDSTDQMAALHKVAERIAGAIGTWCDIVLSDGGHASRVVAHADPAREEWTRQYAACWRPDPPAEKGTHAVIRSGRAQLLQFVTDDALAAMAHDAEHLALLRASGVRSLICVPLCARQRILGALSVAACEETREFQPSDLAFVQQIADRIGLALDNARLYREAQEAKLAAERRWEGEQKARAEAEALYRVAEALSGARLDLETIVQRVTDEATALVGARYGAFFYNVVGENGESYKLYALSGASREQFEQFGLPRNTPIFGPTFAGLDAVRCDDVHKDPRYGQMAPHYGMPEGHLPVVSYLAVPVVSRSGPVIGGLFFGHPQSGQFTEQHERMARALAVHAAVAIDNARHFQEARQAEERQARLVAELERAVRFSEMFVGILGHDLRNPLSGITTSASLIASLTESEQIVKPVDRILRSAGRMSRMIDQILDFTSARLGRGIPLRRKSVDLAELCRAVLDELKSRFEGGADVQFEVRGNTEGLWDEDRLAQLMSNLTGNALQYRAEGTPIVVTVDGTRDDVVTLSVRNDGSIPPEVLPAIFEPLRGGQHRKREGASGLGLGLYISQQIALAHGSALRIDSACGQTAFAVDLPRVPPAQPEQVFGSAGGEDISL
ncbi:MAG TPA: GAF domain-containing protein [Candidatus Limnocylindrales bacterium]|nr:GAF domain-containing protein [Candidatus Limnocylindrales bacterium]